MQALLESRGIQQTLNLVGSQNKYQTRIILIMAWQYLFRNFFLIYYAFLTQPPVFLCEDPLNPGSSYDCNENSGGCLEKKISPNSPSSLVIDLGFYCENNYIRTLGGSFFFIGGNVGVIYSSYMSDSRGRKTAMFYAHLLGSISYFLLGTAATGPYTYVLFLMLIWASMSNYTTLMLTYVAEFCNEKYARSANIFLLMSTLAVGEVVILAAAYFIHNWQVIMICFIGIPTLITNFTFKFLDETPVYLHSRKEFSKAARVLDKMAQVNETSVTHSSTSIEPNLRKASSTSTTAETRKPVKTWNYIQILTHKRLAVRVLTFSLIKLYLSMAYFGGMFALASLGGSIFTNSAIAAIAEGIGYSLSLKAYIFPTRKLLKACLFVIVATGISFLFIPTISCESVFICRPLFIQGVLSLILRTAVCLLYGFIYNLGNELFPPEVRSQSNGISNIFKDMGGAISPIVLLFAEMNQLNPLFMFGVIGFFALGAAKHLPEDNLTSLDNEQSNDIELDYVKMAD